MRFASLATLQPTCRRLAARAGPLKTTTMLPAPAAPPQAPSLLLLLLLLPCTGRLATGPTSTSLSLLQPSHQSATDSRHTPAGNAARRVHSLRVLLSGTSS